MERVFLWFVIFSCRAACSILCFFLYFHLNSNASWSISTSLLACDVRKLFFFTIFQMRDDYTRRAMHSYTQHMHDAQQQWMDGTRLFDFRIITFEHKYGVVARALVMRCNCFVDFLENTKKNANRSTISGESGVSRFDYIIILRIFYAVAKSIECTTPRSV